MTGILDDIMVVLVVLVAAFIFLAPASLKKFKPYWFALGQLFSLMALLGALDSGASLKLVIPAILATLSHAKAIWPEYPFVLFELRWPDLAQRFAKWRRANWPIGRHEVG